MLPLSTCFALPSCPASNDTLWHGVLAPSALVSSCIFTAFAIASLVVCFFLCRLVTVHTIGSESCKYSRPSLNNTFWNVFLTACVIKGCTIIVVALDLKEGIAIACNAVGLCACCIVLPVLWTVALEHQRIYRPGSAAAVVCTSRSSGSASTVSISPIFVMVVCVLAVARLGTSFLPSPPAIGYLCVSLAVLQGCIILGVTLRIVFAPPRIASGRDAERDLIPAGFSLAPGAWDDDYELIADSPHSATSRRSFLPPFQGCGTRVSAILLIVSTTLLLPSSLFDPFTWNVLHYGASEDTFPTFLHSNYTSCTGLTVVEYESVHNRCLLSIASIYDLLICLGAGGVALLTAFVVVQHLMWKEAELYALYCSGGADEVRSSWTA